MLVLLPPSESKADGGDGGPVHIASLSFPELGPTRNRLGTALVDLAADVPATLAALKLSSRQTAEVRRNADLFRSPTLPALSRYTGVLYDALDVPGLSRAELARAHRRLAVASALFGLVRGDERIPAYRLSGGSVLPGVGDLRTLWRPALEPVLAKVDGLVVDLRSSAYSALARVPTAVAVRVVSQDDRGRPRVISHHNKAHKGRLARALAAARSEPRDVDGLVGVARKAGLTLVPTADLMVDLVVAA
ncbi:MAG: peroxide stress protein YaaA [Kutzneria sp.]|nr:peroxide stress protein YaaA [Kutzneria sp.]MBV9845406.1 peroxide stress protein YaaA [Kutzneria sp.]